MQLLQVRILDGHSRRLATTLLVGDETAPEHTYDEWRGAGSRSPLDDLVASLPG